MSEKKKHNPHRRKLYREKHSNLPKEASEFKLGRLRAPAATLFLLSWLMASCGGKEGVQITVGNGFITGEKDINVSGLPQGIMSSMSPDCTLITISGGADLLKSVPVIANDFSSAHVIPNENVEGSVLGEAQFGSKNPLGGCRNEFQFDFVLNIDTKPTTCQEVSQSGGNVTLICDGQGQIIDRNSNQVLATISSPATVPVDQSARTRDVVIVDPAGNRNEMEVNLATTCSQIPGLVRVDPNTKQVQIQLVCDGPGVVTVGNQTTNIATGENWANHSGGSQLGNVNYKQHNTSFSIGIPSQSPPVIQTNGFRYEGGNLVTDASCITALGDNCTVYLDGNANQIPGNFMPSIVSADAIIGGNRDVTLQACDSLGNCVSGTHQAPEYAPFRNIGASVLTSPKDKLAQIVITHPDEGKNLSGVEVSVVQHDPTENRGFNRIFKKGQTITQQADCQTNQASSGQNITVFDCRLPFASGRLEVNFEAKEVGGGSSGVMVVPSTMPELNILGKLGVESTPYLTGMALAALVAYGIKRTHRRYVEAKKDMTKQNFLQFMNEYQFPDDPKERKVWFDTYRKNLYVFGNKHNAYERLFIQKMRLKEIMEMRTAENKQYGPEALLTFIDAYVNDDAAESLIRTTLKGFGNERLGVLQTLLTNMDQYFESAIRNTDGVIKIRRKVVENEQFVTLLKKMLKSKGVEWLWFEADRTMSVLDAPHSRSGKQRRYPHISKESVRYMLLAYLKLPGNEKKWTEFYTLFNDAGIKIKGVEARALQEQMRLI